MGLSKEEFNKITTYKYYAFISYKSEDEKWAKRLQEQIERFRLPAYLCKKNPKTPKRLKPCFRYHTDIGINELKTELQEKLENSKFLIVVCSPRSAKSEWVGEEIETFVRLGRKSNIIPFIVDGVPYSGDENECYHPIIREQFPRSDSRATDQEILGANVHEEGQGSTRTKWNKAVVKVIAKMLGLEFDELWRRYKRRKAYAISSMIFLIISIIIILYLFALPTHFIVRIIDEKHDLPCPKDAELVIGDFHYPISVRDTMETKMFFPGYVKLSNIRMLFRATYYMPTDFVCYPRLRWNNKIEIHIHRDSTFALFGGVVLDEFRMPIENALIRIDSFCCYSDSMGKFRISIPVEQQATVKKIIIYKTNYQSINREEIPYDNAQYILFHN